MSPTPAGDDAGNFVPYVTSRRGGSNIMKGQIHKSGIKTVVAMGRGGWWFEATLPDFFGYADLVPVLATMHHSQNNTVVRVRGLCPIRIDQGS